MRHSIPTAAIRVLLVLPLLFVVFAPAVATIKEGPSCPGVWDHASRMPFARTGVASAALNGHVYAFGGFESSQDQDIVPTAEANYYNIAVDGWSELPPMPFAAGGLTAAVVDETIYLFGVPNGTVLAYGTRTRHWTLETTMPNIRTNLAAVTAGSLIYTIGGRSLQTNPPQVTDVVEVYAPFTGVWRDISTMPTGRSNLAVVLSGNLIYAMGGMSMTDQFAATVEVLNTDTGQWTTYPSLPVGRSGFAAAAIHGTVYAIGGQVSGSTLDDSFVATVDAYYTEWIASGSWTTVTPMAVARGDITAAVVDEVAYIPGGVTYKNSELMILHTAGAYHALQCPGTPLPTPTVIPSYSPSSSPLSSNSFSPPLSSPGAVPPISTNSISDYTTDSIANSIIDFITDPIADPFISNNNTIDNDSGSSSDSNSSHTYASTPTSSDHLNVVALIFICTGIGFCGLFLVLLICTVYAYSVYTKQSKKRTIQEPSTDFEDIFVQL